MISMEEKDEKKEEVPVEEPPAPAPEEEAPPQEPKEEAPEETPEEAPPSQEEEKSELEPVMEEAVEKEKEEEPAEEDATPAESETQKPTKGDKDEEKKKPAAKKKPPAKKKEEEEKPQEPVEEKEVKKKPTAKKKPAAKKAKDQEDLLTSKDKSSKKGKAKKDAEETEEAPKEEKTEAPAEEEKKAKPKAPKKEKKTQIVSPPLFGKYDLTDINVTDKGLERYINLNLITIPHVSGRHANKPFAKARVSIVERLINGMMRTERYTGKKSKTYKVVEYSFEIINKRTKQNPVQVLINALQNTAPREEVTRLRFGGISVPKAVDISPCRRLDLALRNVCNGAIKSSHKNKKSIQDCLATEIIAAAKNDMNSFAISKKEEVERVAKSAR